MPAFIPFATVGPLPPVGRGCFTPRGSAIATLAPSTDVSGVNTLNGSWDPARSAGVNGARGHETTPSPDGVSDPRVRQRVSGGSWRGIRGPSPPRRW